MQKNTFKKSERLKSKKSIEQLFKKGNTLKYSPLVLLFRDTEALPHPALMAVAVPRKKVNKATKRNLVKRRIREAYRLHKTELYRSLEKANRHVEMIFLYQDDKTENYEKIEKAVHTLLQKITSGQGVPQK